MLWDEFFVWGPLVIFSISEREAAARAIRDEFNRSSRSQLKDWPDLSQSVRDKWLRLADAALDAVANKRRAALEH